MSEENYPTFLWEGPERDGKIIIKKNCLFGRRFGLERKSRRRRIWACDTGRPKPPEEDDDIHCNDNTILFVKRCRIELVEMMIIIIIVYGLTGGYAIVRNIEMQSDCFCVRRVGEEYRKAVARR